MKEIDTIELAYRLNGQPVEYAGSPERALLDILREDHQLIGAKPGCGIGRCGACMVWLDDAPVNACLVMAWQLAGRSVRTIESVAADPASLPVRDALAACGGIQCGYCTAGMVMSLTFLHGQPDKTDAADAAHQMCGNLCRCTGYGGLQRTLARLFEN